MGIVTKMHIVSVYCSSGENFNTTTLSGSFCENVCDLFVHQEQIWKCIHENGNALSILLLLRLTCWLHECLCVCLCVCLSTKDFKKNWSQILHMHWAYKSLQTHVFLAPNQLPQCASPYICIRVHVYEHTCVNIYTLYMHVNVSTNVCIHTHMCVHMDTHVYVLTMTRHIQKTRESESHPLHTHTHQSPKPATLLNVGQIGRIDILQHTATHCNTLQQPQHTAMPHQSKTTWYGVASVSRID